MDHAREALSRVYLPVEFPSARTSDSFEMQFNALTVRSITAGFMRFSSAVRIETAEAEPTFPKSFSRNGHNAGIKTPGQKRKAPRGTRDAFAQSH